MMGMAGRLCKEPSRPRRIILRILGICIAVYGAYAFIRRGLPGYMSLQNPFVFFDFEEPLIFFFLDYLAVMGLFVWACRLSSKTATCAILSGQRESYYPAGH